jgi:hypothetical protein
LNRFGLAGLAVLLGAVAASPAWAQSKAGIAAGATYSQLGGEFVSGSDYTWGFMGGVFASQAVTHNVFVQIEANYEQKGGRGTVVASGGPTEIGLGVDYIQVPFLFGAFVPVSQSLVWNFYAGIGIGFRLSCDLKPVSGTARACSESVLALESQSIEWAMPFGTSLDFDLGQSIFSLDLRYSYGLSDVLENANLRNRSWQFIGRWAYPLGR